MKIAFVASPSPTAHESLVELEKRYGTSPVDEADYIVAIGGDGVVLKSFSAAFKTGKPVFALRKTNSVGFLCNDFSPDNLPERLAKAQKVVLHPLRMECADANGAKHAALSLNEVTVLRDSPQSARLSVLIDGKERIARYSGDGLLVATPAGSTAYNHSAGGPIMPLDANTLVMTAICGYRPRRWSYAVLPQDSVIEIKALETTKRPVRIEASGQTTHNIAEAKIWQDHGVNFTLLFDPEQHLGERIVQEQFMN